MMLAALLGDDTAQVERIRVARIGGERCAIQPIAFVEIADVVVAQALCYQFLRIHLCIFA